MSWEAINKIFTRAMIDTQFAQRLLVDPLQTVNDAGFELSPEEQKIFCNAKADDVSDLSQVILTQLGYEEPE
jgi:hypothetical protein